MSDHLDPTPHRGRRTGDVAALLVVAGFAWLVAMLIPLTSGAFWPIGPAGELLREHAVRFTSDPASVLPLRGDSWVLQPWIPGLVQRAAWKVGGMTALVLLQGILAALLAVVAYRVARAWAGAAAATVTTLCFVLLEQPSTLRSEQFALVLGVLLLLVLRGRAWWIAPVIVAAWANLHGSFVLGVGISFAGALGLLRVPEDEEHLRRGLLRATLPARVGLVLATALATFASPLGTGVYSYVRSVRGVTHLDELTPVWSGMDPNGALAALIYVVLVPIVAVRLIELRHSPRPRAGAGWIPLLPPAALLVASYGSVRYEAWFAVAVLPELASALGTLGRSANTTLRPWATRVSVGITVIALAAGIAAVVPTTERQRDYAELGIPSQRLLDVVDRGDVVLASAEWADYVRLRTGARVVVDARLERFRSRDLDAYLDFVDHADGRLARQVHADVVLVHRRTLGEDWPNPRHDVDLGATRLQHAAHDHTGDAFRVTD